MPDNIELNAGSGGAILATDDDGTAQHQYVKLEFGADNTQTKVAATAPLPVQLGDGSDLALITAGGALTVDGSATTQPVSAASLPLPTGAATSANQSTIITSLQLLDDIVQTEDAAHGSGDKGVMPLAVRNDDLAPLGASDGDYAPLQVDSEGALYTVQKSLIDTGNSSTAVLAGGAAFTGTWNDVHHYASLVVSVEASHNSASNGLQFQFSSDGSNADIISQFNYVAADGGISYALPIEAQYFRVVYTNGATLQTHFRLQTIEHANAVLPTDGRLSDNVSPEKRGTITKSAIIAQTSGAGDFVPVAATNGGSLKISLEEADGILGQATMANSIPVTIASNQSALTVDLGANNDVTVTGSVTANAGTNLNTSALALEAGGNLAAAATSLAVIDDWDETDRAKVNLIVGQAGIAAGAGAVGATVPRVTHASDDPVTTAVQIMDDWDQSDRAKVNAQEVSGVMIENAVDVTVKYAIVDAASSGDNTLVASVSGKKIRVLSVFLVSAGTVNVRFESGAGGTALTGQMNLIANTGFVLPYNPHGWFQTADTTLLNLELSGAISVDGALTYIEAE